MKNFRTYQLALQLNRDCANLKLAGSRRDQFERAVLSIALNLAEGSAKPTINDRKKYYYVALGSLREVQTMLELFGKPEQIIQADQLGGHIYKLCHSN